VSVKAEVVEYGIFEKLRSAGNIRTPTGVELDSGVTAQLTRQTHVIPSRLGTSFGIRTRLDGPSLGSRIICAVKVIHPPIVDPNSGAKRYVEQWFTQRQIGKSEAAGYTFSQREDLVPGQWTIQLIYQKKVIAEKSFEVTFSKARSK
jgi:Domain of unknown function (DUF3859)